RSTGLVLAGYLQSGQQRRQVRWVGAECVVRVVPRDLSANELLRDHVAVHGLVADRRTELAGGTFEFVPGGLDGPAYDEGAVVRCPEDHRLVRRGEGADSAGWPDAAVGLVGDREAQVAAHRPAQRLVFRQDVPLDGIRAGGGAEIDFAADEVLGNVV